MAWQTVNVAQSVVLRGTNQQTDVGLPYVAPSYTVPGSQRASGDVVITPAEVVSPYTPSGPGVLRMTGMRLRRFELNNRTAATTMNVGIGFRWANRYWAAGQWDNSETIAYIDDTTDAQDLPAATPDFALETTTVNDGWVLHSDRQFSWISVRIETASTGTPVRAARYSNAAGGGWTDFGTEAEVFYNATPNGATSLVGDANFVDATEVLLVFTPPSDWGKTQPGGLNGVPGGRYAINIRATTAPTTAAEASVIECGSMVAVEAVAPGGIWEQELTTYFDPYADALVAFFSAADAGNRVYAEVTMG